MSFHALSGQIPYMLLQHCSRANRLLDLNDYALFDNV